MKEKKGEKKEEKKEEEKKEQDEKTFLELFLQTHKIKHVQILFSMKEGIDAIPKVIKTLETYDVDTIRSAVPLFIFANYLINNDLHSPIFSGLGISELFMAYSELQFSEHQTSFIKSEYLLQKLHQFDLLKFERIFSAQQINTKFPFLDKQLVRYLLTISGKLRIPSKKYWIPTSIIPHLKVEYPQKLWIQSLEKEAATYSHKTFSYYNTPITKEEVYYRTIFERYFPKRAKLILKYPMFNRKLCLSPN